MFNQWSLVLNAANTRTGSNRASVKRSSYCKGYIQLHYTFKEWINMYHICVIKLFFVRNGCPWELLILMKGSLLNIMNCSSIIHVLPMETDRLRGPGTDSTSDDPSVVPGPRACGQEHGSVIWHACLLMRDEQREEGDSPCGTQWGRCPNNTAVWWSRCWCTGCCAVPRMVTSLKGEFKSDNHRQEICVSQQKVQPIKNGSMSEIIRIISEHYAENMSQS